MLGQTLPTWNINDFAGISPRTLDVHINMLHSGYINKLNREFGGTGLLELPPSEVLRNLRSYLEPENQDFYRNNMGGNVAHTLFWQVISPKPKKLKRNSALKKHFNLNENAVISAVKEEGMARFGSGWVWGVLKNGNEFDIYSTQNHDTPYMRRHIPMFCVDVWEHAYFLDDYGNRSQWLDIITNYLDFDAINAIYESVVFAGIDMVDAWVLNAYP